MKTIQDLKPIPSQNFANTQGDFVYDITLKSCGDFMTYDIYIDDVEIIIGRRLVIGQLMLTEKYQEKDGNFILDTPATEEPNYLNFGSTQFLRYLTAEETEDFRNGY